MSFAVFEYLLCLNLPRRFCNIDVIPRADRVISTESIISRNRIRAQIRRQSAGPKYSADLRQQYNVRHSVVRTFFITVSFSIYSGDMPANIFLLKSVNIDRHRTKEMLARFL